MIVHPVMAMGREHVPLRVIDDAHPAPDSLRAAAIGQAFVRLAGDFYPGLRASAPDGYAEWLESELRVLDWPGPCLLLRTSFAMACDDPAALAPIQRIPHFDTPDPSVVAAVHYLCEPPHSGASFYRHRRTGYERIDANRQPAWRQALVQDRTEHGLPAPVYMDGDDAGFERIGQAELRFNRLILYPANCLHSGDLGQARLDLDAAKGRLTLTSLLQAAGP
jgi:Family of unknown function (DUF6445)